MNTPTLRAEQRVQQNPFDTDAWALLIRENQKSHIDQARSFYESLVTQLPTCGRYWLRYIEHELRSKNYENVEKLYTRCLVKVLNIDLWKSYLHYVRDTKANLPTFREKMAQAYDFALDKVGLDMHSHQIYADYTSFLKQVPASGSYQEYQKIAAVRKVYHKGITTPIFNVDNLWAEYSSFERNINAHLAEKLIQERNRDYQTAKKVIKQMEQVTKGLNRQLVSVPPKQSPAETRQVLMWKKYIQWEKSNPMQTEDFGMFSKRVAYAYEQALLCLGYHPDLWYEAAMFMHEAVTKLSERGDAKLAQKLAEDVASLYERACTTVLTDCALLHFAYADYEEGRKKYQKVATIYQRFIDQPHIDPTLAYIQHMKFARRTEGIKMARAIFKKARDDSRVKHHVYIAAAIMEFYCSKDPEVASRIFDMGLKKFGGESDYALAYVDFRTHLNDDNNTRVLFERVLTSDNLIGDKSLELWDRYLQFECRVGDLLSINKVDTRRRQAVSNEYETKPAALLVDRYKMLDLLPCTTEQLKVLGYKPGAYNTHTSVNGVNVAGSSGTDTTDNNNQSNNHSAHNNAYPRPDTTQMIPFKPKLTPQTHPIAGGTFAYPWTVNHLLSILPPPTCFNGPFVGVDVLLNKLINMPLPSDCVVPTEQTDAVGGAADNGGMDSIKKDMYQLLATTNDPAQVLKGAPHVGAKRVRTLSDDGNDPSNMTGAAPPITNDVYRMRQQRR